MSDYLKAAKQFSFHAEISYDDLLPSGQKLQIAATDDVLVCRHRIYSEYEGETGGKRFWDDGKTITLDDSKHHVYGTEEVPASIDAVLDHVMKVLGFSPPFSDLLHSDPYAILTKNVQYGFYAGLTQVDGRRVDHLAFQEKKIDWQIWIEDGVQFVPLKLVITYKTLPGAPQFIAVFSHWDLTAPAPDGMFAANLPAGAGRITFHTAADCRKENERRNTMKPVRFPKTVKLNGILLGILLLAGTVYLSGDAFGRGGGGGGFGGGGFGGHVGGGGFGGGGSFHEQGGGEFGGERYGGGGFGRGSFGGGGLGSVHGSGDERGAAHDWDGANRGGGDQFSGDGRSGDRQANVQDRQDGRTQRQQGRDNEANQYQQNRNNEINQYQNNRQTYINNYGYPAGYYGGWPAGAAWGGFYSGLAWGGLAGVAIGATFASVPVNSTTVIVEGNYNPYYYSGGVYYAQQGSQYTVVPPPQGAIIQTLPPSCVSIMAPGSTYSDCGGVFYKPISEGYKVVMPPTGITVTNLPDGAVSTTVNGNRYFQYGGVWYQPFYSGSDVIYMTVANPNG